MAAINGRNGWRLSAVAEMAMAWRRGWRIINGWRYLGGGWRNGVAIVAMAHGHYRGSDWLIVSGVMMQRINNLSGYLPCGCRYRVMAKYNGVIVKANQCINIGGSYQWPESVVICRLMA